MSLNEKVVVVASGVGNDGAGVVRVFLGEGAGVVVSSQSEERIDLLRRQLYEAGNRVIAAVGDISTLSRMLPVADRIATENGLIGHIVASLGDPISRHGRCGTERRRAGP